MMRCLVLLALAAILPKTSWAIPVDANCDFYQDVVPGTTYYVYNSEYPNPYTGARSCRWYAKSATNLKLTCRVVSLPASTHCTRDRLSISPSGDFQLADARNFCGTGIFNITSTGNNMNIVFTSFADTTGGRFLCRLEATVNTVPSCDCGWKKQTRIVGGTVAGINEYPMMAGIVNAEQRLLYCGATIISTKHVLSAAHCLMANTSISQLGILVGDHDITTGTDTASASLHLVSNFDPHPLYNPNIPANDIAVITVTDNIIFTMEVGPACLPFQYPSRTFVGKKVDVLGWGLLGPAEERSNVLRTVQLNVTTVSKCQQSFPEVTYDQVCTYTPGKDACGLDSGGPLLWQNPNTMRLVLAGIVSYGVGCADTTPGVNTRVSAYLNWILSVTPGVDYCRIE